MLKSLFTHLNDDAHRALEIALGESLRIGQFWLGLEFLLMGLSRAESNALWELMQTLHLDPGELRGMLRGLVIVHAKDWRAQKDLRALGAAALPALQEATPQALSGLYLQGDPTRLPASPVITPRLLAILRQAVELADGEPVSPNHLLLAAMQHPQCPPINLLIGLMLNSQYDPPQFIDRLVDLSGVKPDAVAPPHEEQAAKPQVYRAIRQPNPPEPPSGLGLLGKYSRDLTALAQAGEISPAVGEYAHKAMVMMGLILQQAQSNNPILLGDPGVGKTAIVEGFAYRLARDPEVIAILSGRRVVDLPMAAILAGTSYRGQMEERLQAILKEVGAAQEKPIIFIDEIHAILGGKVEGGLGAIADALKPALARGDFPCIGATTVAEYRRYIETDPALARRFTPVWIEEPSIADAIEIAKGVAAERLAPHHRVAYPDEVIAEAVHLAVRYIHDEFLPGKVVKLLDQAGPRVTMGGSLRGAGAVDASQPVGGVVTIEVIRQIVAERTGIPLEQLSQSDKERLLGLEKTLQMRVHGQDEAIQAVASVVKRARAGLADPRRPLGVFLFAGPTGVGKTELALALAAALFDDEKALLRLDMSEFMEKYSVARLVGSPPGYIGYKEEGQLTGRLRRQPYCVVLLDEIEKAHPDVQHLFLQLFDAGRISDARGRLVDGCNAMFIMTTNLDAASIQAKFSAEFSNRLDCEVHFNPLTAELLVAIFDKLFEQAGRRFAGKGLQVELSPEFKAKFCARHASIEFGARPLERAINEEIVTPVADRLLAGEITHEIMISPGFVVRTM